MQKINNIDIKNPATRRVCWQYESIQSVKLRIGSKLPNVAALQAEYGKLQEQKETLYADYGKLKKQVKEYGVIKQNIDSILRLNKEPVRGKQQKYALIDINYS